MTGRPEDELLGIGIDMERLDALGRFDESARRAFAERWFAAGELGIDPTAATSPEALVAGMCCKEAVFKAVGGEAFAPAAIVVPRGEAGWGGRTTISLPDGGGAAVHVSCACTGGHAVAVAVAWRGGGAAAPTG